MQPRCHAESFQAIRDKWEQTSRASLHHSHSTTSSSATTTTTPKHAAMPGRPSLPAKAQAASSSEGRDSRLRRLSSFALLNPFTRRDRRKAANASQESVSVADLTQSISNLEVKSPRKATGSKIPNVGVTGQAPATSSKSTKHWNSKKAAQIPRSRTMGNLGGLSPSVEEQTEIPSPVRRYSPSKPVQGILTHSQSTTNMPPPTRIPTPTSFGTRARYPIPGSQTQKHVGSGSVFAGSSHNPKMARSTTQPELMATGGQFDFNEFMEPQKPTLKKDSDMPGFQNQKHDGAGSVFAGPSYNPKMARSTTQPELMATGGQVDFKEFTEPQKPTLKKDFDMPGSQNQKHDGAGSVFAGPSHNPKMARSTTQPELMATGGQVELNQFMAPQKLTFNECFERPIRTSSLANENTKPPKLPRPVSLGRIDDWFSGDEEEEHPRESISDDNDEIRPLWAAKLPVRVAALDAAKARSRSNQRPQTPAPGSRASSNASETRIPRLSSSKNVLHAGLMEPLSPVPRSPRKPLTTAFEYGSPPTQRSPSKLLPKGFADGCLPTQKSPAKPLPTAFKFGSSVNLANKSTSNLADNSTANDANNSTVNLANNSTANVANNTTASAQSEERSPSREEQSTSRASISSDASSDMMRRLREITHAQECGWWSGRFRAMCDRYEQRVFTADLAEDPRTPYEESLTGEDEKAFRVALIEKARDTRQYLKVFDELWEFCVTDDARLSLAKFEIIFFQDLFDRLRFWCRDETGHIVSKRVQLVQDFKTKFANDNELPELLEPKDPGRQAALLDMSSPLGRNTTANNNGNGNGPIGQPSVVPQQQPAGSERKTSFMEKLKSMTSKKF